MNEPSNRNKRIAFMLSGIMDAIIGAVLLSIGLGWLSFDVTQYGLQNWHVNLLGAIMFIIGAATAIYNLSRLQE